MFVTERQLFFQPSEVDFGVTPLGFENLNIALYVTNRGSRKLTVLNVYFPVQDARLEYSSQVREPHVLNPGKDLLIGDAFLSSTSEGKIEQHIVVLALDAF